MNQFDLLIESIEMELLEEKKRRRTIPKSKVNKISQENRKDRAKNVIIKFVNEEYLGDGDVTKHSFLATSAEKSESEEHEGFVEIFNKSDRIDHVSCSCSDFQSRFRYYRNKEGVNKWNDGVIPKNEIFDPHTRETPDIMNKNNDGYLCKHLIKAVDYLGSSDTN